ncbi:hypothetical protein FB451DRAFT_1194771 [Mycena latifolia]|nr:hypothetical protein FB451DRAFT_1194771 [Mycena latifolia]
MSPLLELHRASRPMTQPRRLVSARLPGVATSSGSRPLSSSPAARAVMRNYHARRGPDPNTIIACFESAEIATWLIDGSYILLMSCPDRHKELGKYDQIPYPSVDLEVPPRTICTNATSIQMRSRRMWGFDISVVGQGPNTYLFWFPNLRVAALVGAAARRRRMRHFDAPSTTHHSIQKRRSPRLLILYQPAKSVVNLCTIRLLPPPPATPGIASGLDTWGIDVRGTHPLLTSPISVPLAIQGDSGRSVLPVDLLTPAALDIPIAITVHFQILNWLLSGGPASRRSRTPLFSEARLSSVRFRALVVP